MDGVKTGQRELPSPQPAISDQQDAGDPVQWFHVNCLLFSRQYTSRGPECGQAFVKITQGHGTVDLTTGKQIRLTSLASCAG